MIRRVVALAVVIGLMAGVVSLAKALFGSETSKAAGDTVGSVAAEAMTDSSGLDPAVSTTPAVSDPAAVTSTTVAVPTDAGTVPTAADPARVLLLGDSEAGGLAPYLGKVLQATGLTAMTLDYKVSSGLVRPDFFDWPAHLRETVPAANPDIVVALFGGNDGQPFLNTNNKVDSPEWRAEYGKRVADVMDFLSADGRTLVWVGVPNGEDPSLTANLKVQNEVVESEAAKHPKVIFVNSWNYFTGIDGGFAPYVVDPRDGLSKPVRSKTDGFHLNTVGEEILAVYVGNAIAGELRTRGAAI